MATSTFFKQLAIVSIISAVGILLLPYINMAAHQNIGWASLGLFVLLCLPMYYLSQRAMRSEDKLQFTNLFLIFTSTKMFAAILIVFVYHKIAAPSSKLFLVPFFAIYLIYTIFEIYFLTKISNSDTL